MGYESITLNYNGNESEYYLIDEIFLDKYNSNYILFTDDVSKDEMNVYCMKVMEDGSLANVSSEEETDCKAYFDGGNLNG